jgi:[CysO sulfur-carrier protein]-S-L-cysteine hydrolase
MGLTTIIVLSNEQLDELAHLAKDSLPNESCAFLLGRGESEVIVDEIFQMNNADQSMISFSIEPQELLRAYQLAEKKKLQIVGIFHSHPAEPVPSSIDRRFMEINPVVWLIYSSITNQFRAYIYCDKVREVTLKVKE